MEAALYGTYSLGGAALVVFVHSLVMETIDQEAFGLEKLEKNAISFDYDMMM